MVPNSGIGLAGAAGVTCQGWVSRAVGVVVAAGAQAATSTASATPERVRLSGAGIVSR